MGAQSLHHFIFLHQHGASSGIIAAHWQQKTQPKAGLLLNGAKETRTPDPLHAMQLVRSSEFACGNRKKPSIKGISEKLAIKPLWLARASYGGFALKIALSF